MKMYKVNRGWRKISIIEVEITRVTDHTVWYMDRGHERREAKSSEHQRYFNTISEAKEYALELINRKVDNLTRELNELEDSKKKVEAWDE